MASGDAGQAQTAPSRQLSICAMTRDELQSDTWGLCEIDAGLPMHARGMRVLTPPAADRVNQSLAPIPVGKPHLATRAGDPKRYRPMVLAVPSRAVETIASGVLLCVLSLTTT